MKKAFLVLLALCLMLGGCAGYDGPPEGNGPEPPALDGRFACDYGSLTFNGDGSTVTVEVSEALAQAEGMEPGTYEGTYVFTFRNGSCPYDRAEALELHLAGKDLYFLNNHPETNETRISVYSNGDAQNPMNFVKIEGEQ